MDGLSGKETITDRGVLIFVCERVGRRIILAVRLE